MGLVSELRRRNVFRVAIAYVIIAWLILQVGDTLAPALHLDEWVNTALAFFLILGFPLAVFFAWAYELTPEGIKLEKHVDRSHSVTHVTGRKLDFLIIAGLLLALVFFAFDKFVLDPSRDAELVQTTTAAVTEQAAKSSQSESAVKSIAVLPFVNMSADPNNEYFSDGISEEILNLLVKVPKLRVTSRSSAFSFKGQNVDVPTMAAKLNVAYVLEGSVRKSGNQLRITAQLIEVAADTHIWSETYERELESVFAIQDEIAAAVVSALRIKLLTEPAKAAETHPDAFVSYLQALHAMSRPGLKSSNRAEALLHQSLSIDESYAPAWVALARVYWSQTTSLTTRPFRQGSELTRSAADQALAVDPRSGSAYAVLALVEMNYDWDFSKAERYVRLAMALDPGNVDVLDVAAYLDAYLGRFDKAIDLGQRMLAQDPLSPSGYMLLGRVYYCTNQLQKAAENFRLAQSAVGWIGQSIDYRLGVILLKQGDLAAAMEMMERESSDAFRLTGTAFVEHAMGDARASNRALQELIKNWSSSWSFQIAQVYAFRGENDSAFNWLEKAYENHDSAIPSAPTDPLLVGLHDDQRWEKFLYKLSLPL